MGEENKNLRRFIIISFFIHILFIIFASKYRVDIKVKPIEVREVKVVDKLKYYAPIKRIMPALPQIKAKKEKAIIVKPFKIKGGKSEFKKGNTFNKGDRKVIKEKSLKDEDLKNSSLSNFSSNLAKKGPDIVEEYKKADKKKLSLNLDNKSMNKLFAKKDIANRGSSDNSSVNLKEKINSAYFSGSGHGRGADVYGASAVFDVKGYDITPWVKRALYRIKKNWFPPLASSWGKRGKVTIFAVFMPSGKLGLLKIYKGSEIKAYNISAFQAFKLSNPFPPLPEDFPNKYLRAYFTFIF